MTVTTAEPPVAIRAPGFFTDDLASVDPAVAAAIGHELDRERHQIELIASENIVSKAVLAAQGSVFTNKYAEGYPGKRYYQGCAPSDEVESLAIERAKQLFDCGFANVQPHSGAQANGAVMLALTKPGATILGMSLDAGGHLTHGAALERFIGIATGEAERAQIDQRQMRVRAAGDQIRSACLEAGSECLRVCDHRL